MKKIESVKPEDILPDGIDSTIINGKTVRKGSIAAFLANTDIIENLEVSEAQKQQALATLKELAPAVIAIGLHKHVIFKNPMIEEILVDIKSKTDLC